MINIDIFNIFDKNWAIVSAGNINCFNCCTVSWGSIGNIWGSTNGSRKVITVYIHPNRFTCQFMKENEYFSVSFFKSKYKDKLLYIGSHSGRNENKILKSGLEAIEFKNSIHYKQAEITFLCKKLYFNQINKDNLNEEIKMYYASKPGSFYNSKGEWEPHFVFIGEVIDTINND